MSFRTTEKTQHKNEPFSLPGIVNTLFSFKKHRWHFHCKILHSNHGKKDFNWKRSNITEVILTAQETLEERKKMTRKSFLIEILGENLTFEGFSFGWNIWTFSLSNVDLTIKSACKNLHDLHKRSWSTTAKPIPLNINFQNSNFNLIISTEHKLNWRFDE